VSPSLRGLWLFAAVVAAPFAHAAGVPTAGDHDSRLTHDGRVRTYRLHVPPGADARSPAPLVVVLHGGGGNAVRTQRLMHRGFERLADRDRFFVVYPEGIDHHWNDGRTGEETGWSAQRDNVDDVGFIAALLDKLGAELPVDPRRVYVTGISNGAMMSQRLGCELAGRLAAIAPVAGTMPQALAPTCKPARALPVLMVLGMDDPLVPYAGGEVHFGRRQLGRVLSAADTVDFWVRQDRCAASPERADEPDRDPRDGTRVRREAYSGCRDGADIVLYSVEGGGHAWPGGEQYLPAVIVGRSSRDIDATEIIWDFFRRHVAPAAN
jgi:polyhydroxybutyrate depolymerase